MEESKYYTPEIEEFYIGFECEFIGEARTDWVNCVIDWVNMDFITFHRHLAAKQYRVKFLDREDIESLGWKFSLIKANTNRAFKDLQSNTEKCIGLVLEIRNDKIMIADCRLEFNQILFFGTIKNKSELRKLMQMLQIK